MNTLKINGTTLPDIFVDASLSFNKPQKKVETIEIPGRNGALVIDDGTYENVIIKYPCYIHGDFETVFNDLLSFLAPLKGYLRIECSNDPDHFRQGRFIVPQTPVLQNINRFGRFDLAFDCKPQRWLISGEESVVFSANGAITNPTSFEAQPLLIIGKNIASSIVGDTSITIVGATADTAIDCDLMDCYLKGSPGVGKNDIVSFSSNDFPKLMPGSNNISGTGLSPGAANSIEIVPRWWEL